MSQLLRKIKLKKWFPDDEVADWLEPDDIEADPIGDLATEQNALSLYEIRDDRSNLGRVIAALAANQRNPREIEYALVNEEVLLTLGFEMEWSVGELPDPEVNAWHWELKRLSAKRLPVLVKAFRDQQDLDTFLPPKVIDALEDSLNKHYIDENKIAITDPGTRRKLNLPVKNK